MMNSSTLETLSKTQVIGRRFECLDTIDSTNTECKRRAQAAEPEGLVIIADEQTQGRGRYGRTFHSPAGKGLYYSCLLRPQLRPQEAVDLTAWIAAAVCDAIEETCGASPMIKWTNDIILGGKKLCGILTEMDVDTETGTIRSIVPGIGINVNHREEDLDPSIRTIATSLALQLGHEVDRTALAAALTRQLDRLYRGFPAKKEEYLQKYRRRCCTVGCPLVLHYAGGSSEEAFGLAIDDDFRLVVRMADGQIRHVGTGEVSVRGLCGYV